MPGGDPSVDVLYVTPQKTGTSEALTEAARRRGMEVVEYRSAADRAPGTPFIYGGPIFAQSAASVLSVALLEPHDDWLVRLPRRFRRREIQLTTLSEARDMPGRWFIKTPREKTFEAGVYSADELPAPESSEDTVLISDIVTFSVEYRFLVLDAQVHAASRYLSHGRLDVGRLEDDPDRDSVIEFTAELLADQSSGLPSAVTVDIGWAINAETAEEGWAVVEANMTWFSNIYAADPDKALDVVMRSAGPRSQLSGHDARFAYEREIPRS